MNFIVTRTYGPNSDARSYQFPYRIGIAGRGWMGAWTPNMATLCSNLSVELDTNAANHKLRRVGEAIKTQNLPIDCIHVAYAEDDTLDVYVNREHVNNHEVWKQIACIISTAFGLPVKL